MTFVVTDREEPKAKPKTPLLLKPRGNYVLLVEETVEVSEHLEIKASRKPKQYRVVDFGEGYMDQGGKVRSIRSLSPGDLVVFDPALVRTGPNSAASSWMHPGCAATGKTYFLVPEDAIQAVYTGDLDHKL